ncbi:hypothetical protein Nepgr_013848 [Nepenthes gracilis]|uniref:Uncharacterized protein n=1 Tax=Nepenthes gracilis TaxID=150966 RepID=A0AAD3SJ40_NEPGR|nr:hypothetical protein Nepgr_013848 [Nepenthes gracilis]
MFRFDWSSKYYLPILWPVAPIFHVTRTSIMVCYSTEVPWVPKLYGLAEQAVASVALDRLNYCRSVSTEGVNFGRSEFETP